VVVVVVEVVVDAGLVEVVVVLVVVLVDVALVVDVVVGGAVVAVVVVVVDVVVEVVEVVGAWQEPPTQVVPAPQQTPLPRAGSSPHGRLPSAQTHWPLMQSWPLPHWKPHAPQLKSSVACGPVTIVQ